MDQLINIQSVIEYISELYSSWQEVNRLLKIKIQHPDSGDLFSQEFLFSFYNKHKEPNVFQTKLLNLILASSAEKAGVITTPLLVLLRVEKTVKLTTHFQFKLTTSFGAK